MDLCSKYSWSQVRISHESCSESMFYSFSTLISVWCSYIFWYHHIIHLGEGMDPPSMHHGSRRRMNADIWTAALAGCIISSSGRISPNRGSLWEMDSPQSIRLTSKLQERQKTRIPQWPLITGGGAFSHVVRSACNRILCCYLRRWHVRSAGLHCMCLPCFYCLSVLFWLEVLARTHLATSS